MAKEAERRAADEGKRGRLRRAALWMGPLLGLAVFLVVDDAPAVGESGVAFGIPGRTTLGLMVWMATWWLTEAVHVSVTALLPVVVLPLVSVSAHRGASEAMAEAVRPYAGDFIFLFMGGFLLALSMERWGLHRRIALITLRLVGSRPRNMVGGFMAIAAIMSMWVSNTATCVMMLPIAGSVADLLARGPADEEGRRFGLCLFLGLAYSCSIGGIGTLIGTPPNLLLAQFLQDRYGTEVSFAAWLGVGLPLVAVFTPLVGSCSPGSSSRCPARSVRRYPPWSGPGRGSWAP